MGGIGSQLSPTILEGLTRRLISNAVQAFDEPASAYRLIKPITLPQQSLADRPEVHDLTCTADATHRVIFIPFLCKGHWILACVRPVNPGRVIFSSRKFDGIPEVKMALSSASRDRDTPGRRGTPIVSWRSNVSHSPREHPRSNDGGVFLLLHIASILFGCALSPCLTRQRQGRPNRPGLLSLCRGGGPQTSSAPWGNLLRSRLKHRVETLSPCQGVPPPSPPPGASGGLQPVDPVPYDLDPCLGLEF